ncbi:MAG: peptidoglycan-binding domain-containing protein [Gammaproteobacteria bacterium]
MLKKYMILLLVSMSLVACGTMPEERAISGGGIGAAGGAIIGAVTGLTVLQGAAIGAVAGALTGVLTDKDKVNLGKPVWKQGTSSGPGPQTSATPSTDKQTVSATAADNSTDEAPADNQPTVTAANNPEIITDKRLVMEIQSGLIRLGYNPGPVDGVNGQRTRKAISIYQEYHGLNVDGQATLGLAEHIRMRNYYLGGVNVHQTGHSL